MGKTKDKLDWIVETYGDLLKVDGFDDCILGVVHRFGQDPILCYSRNKVIKKLERQGMTCDDAKEFFEYNQLGSWVGKKTPCFLDIF